MEKLTPWLAGRTKPGRRPPFVCRPLPGEACAYITFITVWFVARAEARMKSTAPWSGLRGLWPVTHDLPRWPLPSPRSPYSPSPALDHVTSVWCSASFSALALALLLPGMFSWLPCGVAGCFSNFRSRFQGSHLKEAFSGHLGLLTLIRTFQQEFLLWMMCLFVWLFFLHFLLFSRAGTVIYLPLYPYIRNKRILNLVSNSYSNCLKFSFTRLNQYVLSGWVNEWNMSDNWAADFSLLARNAVVVKTQFWNPDLSSQ